MKIEIPGYEIIRELGKGGMATVYLAIQESFGREVALKVMSPSLSADPDFHERFLREAQIVSRLVHPNIVTVYDVGERDGHHYLSMEYVKGQDLRHRRDSLTLLQRLHIVKEVAQALDYASKKGYIHRDIKPDNIMLREDDGRAVLMDFGIARTVEADMSMTQTGTVIGTPQYMSPEQARGLKADHRADLYSLGVVLFQLLAGRVPYHAETPVAVALKHITEPVPKLPPKLRAFQPVIDKALAKDPEARYQSGAELVAALDTISQAYERALRERKARVADNGEERTRPLELEPKADEKGLTAAKADSIRVPQEYQRAHKKEEKRGGWGIWLLLLVVIGGLGAAYYTGHLQPYLAYLTEPGDTPRPPEVSEPPPAAGEAARNAPDSAVASSDGEPEGEPAGSEVEGESGEDERSQTAALEAAPEPPETGSGETGALDKLLPGVGKLLNGKPSLDTKIREQAEALEPRVEEDISVIPQLAQLYLLVLSDQPEDAWAGEGLQRLQQRHLEKARELLAAGRHEEARLSLEMAQSSYPEERRDPGFAELANDLARAERIERHLQAAKDYIAANALTSPEGANALESYRAVLEEEPDHPEARAGITRIAERYEVLARSHLDRGEYPLAAEMVKRGLGIEPEHPQLLALKSQVNSHLVRRQQIDDLMEQARTLMVAGRLTQPSGQNAYDVYQRILQLEPGNGAARDGMQAIERELQRQVQQAMEEGENDKAATLLAEARERFPRSGDLLELQGQLDEAMEAAARAALEATRPKVTELRVSGHKLASLEVAQADSLRLDRTLFIGFKYRNFQADTTVMQAILYDGARTLEIAQVPVIVSGSEGMKFFQIDRPVEGFPEGGYNLDLVLDGEQMVSIRFQVQK
ncbi:MAG: hypothetical protein Kow006_33220 [Gammaproteobacteria bacterium]